MNKIQFFITQNDQGHLCSRVLPEHAPIDHIDYHLAQTKIGTQRSKQNKESHRQKGSSPSQWIMFFPRQGKYRIWKTLTTNDNFSCIPKRGIQQPSNCVIGVHCQFLSDEAQALQELMSHTSEPRQ